MGELLALKNMPANMLERVYEVCAKHESTDAHTASFYIMGLRPEMQHLSLDELRKYYPEGYELTTTPQPAPCIIHLTQGESPSVLDDVNTPHTIISLDDYFCIHKRGMHPPVVRWFAEAEAAYNTSHRLYLKF